MTLLLLFKGQAEAAAAPTPSPTPSVSAGGGQRRRHHHPISLPLKPEIDTGFIKIRLKTETFTTWVSVHLQRIDGAHIPVVLPRVINTGYTRVKIEGKESATPSVVLKPIIDSGEIYIVSLEEELAELMLLEDDDE